MINFLRVFGIVYLVMVLISILVIGTLWVCLPQLSDYTESPEKLAEIKHGCYWQEWLLPAKWPNLPIVQCEDRGANFLAIAPFFIISPVFGFGNMIKESFFSDLFGLFISIGLVSFFGFLATMRMFRRGLVTFCAVCFLILWSSIIIRNDVYPEIFPNTRDDKGCEWETSYWRDMMIVLPGPTRMVCHGVGLKGITEWLLNIPNHVVGIRISESGYEKDGSWRTHVSWFHKSIPTTIYIAAFLFTIYMSFAALHRFFTASEYIDRMHFFFAYMAICFVAGRLILSRDIYGITPIATIVSFSVLCTIISFVLREKWRTRKLAATSAAGTPGVPPTELPPLGR